ncbi:MAG: hypothetical protein EOO91_13980 [Pedobacter sp.]|nr:MAG: hypothetical protein EOO91_13980 [Pedobacter sp.]
MFAIFYDSLIKIWVLITKPKLLDWIDDLEENVLSFSETNISLHKYGGTQFNYLKREFGHLHSNGILDILLDQQLKSKMLIAGRINDHHVFKNSGWISFYIQKEDDVEYAKELLQIAYSKIVAKGMPKMINEKPFRPLK